MNRPFNHHINRKISSASTGKLGVFDDLYDPNENLEQDLEDAVAFVCTVAQCVITTAYNALPQGLSQQERKELATFIDDLPIDLYLAAF